MPERSTRAFEVGERIHMDIGRPLGVDTYCGQSYFIIFKDEFSTYRFVFLMKSRSEAHDCIRSVVAHVKADAKKDVRYIFSDRGSEFTSNRSQEFLLDNKIIHQISAPFTPAQNGFIERDNRTLMEGVRTMLLARQVPSYLWGEALMTLAFILNRTVNSRSSSKTPYEIYFANDKKPKLDQLKVFGWLYLYKTQTKKRSGYQQKIEERGREAIFTGYEADFTYRVFDIIDRKIIVTSDVKFDELKCSNETPDLNFLNDWNMDFEPEDDDEAIVVEDCPLEPSN